MSISFRVPISGSVAKLRGLRRAQDCAWITLSFRYAQIHGALAWVVILSSLICGAGAAPTIAATEPLVPDDGSVLTRGPIHEAFAQQTEEVLKPGATAPKQPPDPIEEIPPEAKPEGEGVEWIPGYWHWDEERSGFIWISGVWRVVPAGMRWVPGYWTLLDGRYRRVPGMWVSAEAAELAYQPQPPESVEIGPSSNRPSEDCFWVPGCWVYQSTRYCWRPGYWTPFLANRVWIPSYYSWSPGGYVFVDGYWDYPFAARGTLFCPVYFGVHHYTRPSFCYRPCVVLSAADVFVHLFIRPGCSSYYFGDYYSYRHGLRPYYPWFEFRQCGRRYDPFYTHFACSDHRQGTVTLTRYRGLFDYYSQHTDYRPCRTLADQRRFGADHGHRGEQDHFLLAQRLDEVKSRTDLPQRWQPVEDKHREELSRRLTSYHQLERERLSVETLQTTRSRIEHGDRATRLMNPRTLSLPDTLSRLDSKRTVDNSERAPNVENPSAAIQLPRFPSSATKSTPQRDIPNGVFSRDRNQNKRSIDDLVLPRLNSNDRHDPVDGGNQASTTVSPLAGPNLGNSSVSSDTSQRNADRPATEGRAGGLSSRAKRLGDSLRNPPALSGTGTEAGLSKSPR
jgi:hypothetical protein